jgi:hypothetical protein
LDADASRRAQKLVRDEFGERRFTMKANTLRHVAALFAPEIFCAFAIFVAAVFGRNSNYFVGGAWLLMGFYVMASPRTRKRPSYWGYFLLGIFFANAGLKTIFLPPRFSMYPELGTWSYSLVAAALILIFVIELRRTN